jgi:hypothetical protein
MSAEGYVYFHLPFKKMLCRTPKLDVNGWWWCGGRIGTHSAAIVVKKRGRGERRGNQFNM